MSCGGSTRKKVNVFISFSSGCEVKCGFCFLTAKNFLYEPIPSRVIANNVVLAIKAELVRRPGLRELPLNLSWKGMGDAWCDLSKVYKATKYIIEALNADFDQIEGVDIATTLPQIRYDDLWYLQKLQSLLKNTGKLISKPTSRTDVRIFYSLHSLQDNTRRSLIPRTLDIDIAALILI